MFWYMIMTTRMIRGAIWLAAVSVLFYFGIAIIMAGIVGEGFSLWSLFYETDTLAIRKLVLWSMFGLLVLMAVRPGIGIVRSTLFWKRKDQVSDSNDASTSGKGSQE